MPDNFYLDNKYIYNAINVSFFTIETFIIIIEQIYK